MKKNVILTGVFAFCFLIFAVLHHQSASAAEPETPSLQTGAAVQKAASAEDASKTKTPEGQPAAAPEAQKKIKESELGLVEGKSTIEQATAKLKELGLANIRVHRGAGDMGDIVSADGLDFMLRFGIFGYSGAIDLSDNLMPNAKPRNYAVKIVPDGTVFITAEDFTLNFPGGKAKQGVLSCRWIENSMLTSQHDLSVLARESGGFLAPEFFMNMEGDKVILHARDAKGKDWQDGIAFSSDTGKITGRIKWDDVKSELKL